MAYCIAKSIEIQRSKALKEIFLEDRSIAQVARRFGRNRFEMILDKNSIQIRHTRVRRPNDNAHIERFNRTMHDD